DPHWFGLTVMSYLKHWQAPDDAGVTVRVPALDVLAEGALEGVTATYRFVVRNHGVAAVDPIDVQFELPAGTRLSHCWLGAEGLGRCGREGRPPAGTLPKPVGNNPPAGPFGGLIDVSSVKAGAFTATIGLCQEAVLGVLAQEVTLQKP